MTVGCPLWYQRVMMSHCMVNTEDTLARLAASASALLRKSSLEAQVHCLQLGQGQKRGPAGQTASP